ncbi:MAG: choice-of-anchor Q domain-containing protein [Candidatus Eiseniibacteriota bacterium]
MHRHCSVPIPLVLLFSSVAVSAASAGTITWSGPHSPCGATLQACIDAASPGDVIEVATNVPIYEDLTIDKSLVLTAALGFSPVLGDPHFVILSNPDPLANQIRFEYFTVTRGFVYALQTSGGTFDVGIQYLTIQNAFDGRPEIQVGTGSPGSFGRVQAGIVGNRLTIPPNSQSFGASAIVLEGGHAASLSGLIQGNRIDHFDGGQEGAIGVFNLDAALDVTVVANEIRGSDYNEGVKLFQFGNGSSNVRFLDNLVVGQTNESGGPASYGVSISSGSATFEIVNNTAADGDNGIGVSGRDDLGASWSGVVANNIVSGMTALGISIAQPELTSGVVENDHNLVFDVGFNGFTPGPGTLFQDPLFIGGGNYRLTDPSPARNAGSDARVPSDLTTDLDVNPRMVGRVDMGAYESSSLVAALPASYQQYRLHPNAPNPFQLSTTIRYELPRPEYVRLGVFDARGRLVRWLVSGAFQESGLQVANWDGRGEHGRPMASGIYFYRLEAGRFLDTRRMVLLQ